MDIVGTTVALVADCLSAPIGRSLRYHKGVYKYMNILKQKLEELNCRKRDIESRLNVDLVSGETILKEEVENWFRKVETINDEVKTIEEQGREVKFFSRASLGKKVTKKVKEVEEIHKNGEFPNGLVISLLKRGEVLPTIKSIDGETTFRRKMEEIWECLMGDEVPRIGVYGMGGIGKTTALEYINNRVLERKDKFESVIWVTVSRTPDGANSLLNLQDKIARKLDLKISNDDDEITRAAKLFAEFDRRKRFVLILDDLWEADYSLKEVGIPELTSQNGCKLVVTTRSLDVCRRMSCKEISMELFSEDEALRLFLDVVGRGIISVPKLERTVKDIVRECAGLPLAIVTVAGSLKGTFDYDEWAIALEELRKSTKGCTFGGIYERLKFSYDRLNNKQLKDCLLYCALYPEDYEIERDILIEHLIVEGIIEGSVTRQSEIRKGQVMLNKLVNVCLLSDTTNGYRVKCVKMHDLIRDMAIQLTSESPRFLVKAGMRLKVVPGNELWKDDLAKVSLMENDIRDVDSRIEPPECPILSTLLLSQNENLSSISANFFLHMKDLNVLDLSRTSIRSLPDSVSDLVTLTALFLSGCYYLRYVPSLAKLKGLRTLDLGESGLISEVPQGVEMLVKLKYLNINGQSLKTIPDQILFKLTNLQYLTLNRHMDGPKVRAEELKNLQRLETFEGVFNDISSFNEYIRSSEQRSLTSYILQLGSGSYRDTGFGRGIKIVHLTHLVGRSESEESCGKCLLLLPEDFDLLSVRQLRINVSNLCEFISFENVTDLRSCNVSCCDTIKHAFSYSSRIIPFLQSLETLALAELPALCGLIKTERKDSSPLPPATFSSLKSLHIHECNKIKMLLTIASLPNLEKLSLIECEQLKEITSMTSNDDHAIINILSLPKLRDLFLSKLPKLESIAVVANSLQNITIYRCPRLKRIPPLDREPPPSSLKSVRIDENLWKSLEWDHPDAMDVAQSLRSLPHALSLR